MPDSHSLSEDKSVAPLPEDRAKQSSALVEIENVTKSFGYKIALKNITFSVPSGQICGLLGPNGAGKTTLFRLLMGILKATEGRLLIDNRDAFDDRVEVKRLIGFLPDEPVFYSYLSGREVLELSAAMHGLDVQATMDRITPVMAKLRLAEDIDNYAEDYSRGMKKSSDCFWLCCISPSSWFSMSLLTDSMSSRLIFSTTLSLKQRNWGPPCCFQLT